MKRHYKYYLISGIIVILITSGIMWDYHRASRAKSEMQIKVDKAASDALLYLPYRPREAVEAGFMALESMNITPDPGSVIVTADGKTVKVSVISGVNSHFLWIFGMSKIKFTAEKKLDTVSISGDSIVEKVN